MKLASSAVATVAAVSISSLCGCASVFRGPVAEYDDVDHGKVATITRVARDRGVIVVWVNPPTKRTTAVGVAPATAEPARS